MYIAIAGNIGSGKTTLTNLLARHYGWTPKFETVAENPYLADYYADIKRWSFAMEVFFLKQRFKDVLDISNRTDTVIQDRSIYEGVYVFAANNRDMGFIDKRDFQTYMDLFDQMMGVVPMPKLMIYLRASVAHLSGNIARRGRDYERELPVGYLDNLNKRYDDFIYNKYPGETMVVETDQLDFEHNQRDFGSIVSRIDARLFGIFSSEDNRSNQPKLQT